MSAPKTDTRKRLIQLIHIGKSKLGLDDKHYRLLLLETTGLMSAAQMSAAQLNAVLDEMKRRAFAPPGSGKANPSLPAKPRCCARWKPSWPMPAANGHMPTCLPSACLASNGWNGSSLPSCTNWWPPCKSTQTAALQGSLKAAKRHPKRVFNHARDLPALRISS